MKIGLTQMITGSLSIEECIDLCKEAGYEAFELLFSKQTGLSLDSDPEELKSIKNLFKDAHIELTSITAGLINLLSPEKREIEKAKRKTIRLLEIANYLDIDAVLIPPAFLTSKGTYSQAWDRFGEIMKDIIPTAADNKVHLCIENLWNKFLLSPREMRQFIDEVGSEWIKVYLDSANMMAYGFPEQWIRELENRIYRVHFKDFSRSEHQFVNLMEGDTNWPLVMKELNKIGYKAPVLYEVSGDWDDMVAGAETMRKLVQMV